MVDWAGHASGGPPASEGVAGGGQSTEYRYRSMAERQLRGVSPSYERICRGVAGDAELIARLDALPPPKRQPNLLLGTVRYLSGPVDSYAGFRAFVMDRWDEVAATMRVRRTQTSGGTPADEGVAGGGEARRCATLLPALAAIDGPVALLEVGASAGLCLQPDRYAYRYDESPVLGDCDLVLNCRTSGAVPVPDRLPDVVWRAGLDLNPLDVRDDDDMRWLRSLIWPEESERFTILDRAVEIARSAPARITRGDLLTDLAAVAAGAPADATLVVYHSAVLAYLPDERRGAFRHELAGLAAERPTVWISNEGPGVVVDLPIPDGPVPFVLAKDGAPLATTSPHGDWIAWLP